VKKLTASARRFRIVVEAVDSDSYNLRLEVSDGSKQAPTITARVNFERLTLFHPAIRVALRDSGHGLTAVGPNRKKPIDLTEPAGVRLSLAINAAGPLNRPSRRQAVLEGIASMSDEETYYWYAKTSNPLGRSRSLRALRILLADDDRSGITA